MAIIQQTGEYLMKSVCTFHGSGLKSKIPANVFQKQPPPAAKCQETALHDSHRWRHDEWLINAP